ncbi:MAG TPA: PDZ domain-containing protein, partial [Magnetococcales bacterium]|nr:PDZ domain-containing protein [Magnetococcales bacterium]
MGIGAIFILFALLQVLGMGGLTIETGEILRFPEGDRVEQAVLMDHLARYRIVLVGETHDDPGHHVLQEQIVRSMAERGGELALAMEMFPRSQQTSLDRWSAGKLGEVDFLDAVTWYFTWGFDAELYLPILRLAREYRIPVVAMNIDRAIVSQVRTQGLDSLDAEVRKTLPVLAEALPEYRERLQEVFDSHPMMAKDGSLANFIDAQRLWDGVMAQALFDWLRQHPQGRVVALAGSGHLLMKHGIAHQLAAMGLENDTVTLLPWDGAENPVPWQAADFVWGTPTPILSEPMPRLGVGLESAPQGGIVITEITPDSPAQKAGLKKGDQPLSLDGHPLPNPHTLVRMLRSQKRNPRPT